MKTKIKSNNQQRVSSGYGEPILIGRPDFYDRREIEMEVLPWWLYCKTFSDFFRKIDKVYSSNKKTTSSRDPRVDLKNLDVKGQPLKKLVAIGMFFSLLFSFLPSSASAATLRKPPNNLGLVGYWNFNEGTSTIAGDSSGNGNAGTLTGMSNPSTPTSGWGTGKRGSGLNFDGSNDYVDIGTPSALDISGAVSVTAWLKLGTTAGGVAIIAGQSTAGGLSEYSFDVNRTAGKLEALSNGSTVVLIGNTTLLVNTWYHVAMTRSGSSGSWDYTLYVNGVNDGSVNTATNPDTQGSFAIGRFGAYSTGFFLNGSVDEVRVYNRALSASEVAALYQTSAAKINTSQNSVVTNGLVGQWSFNGPDMNWVTNKALDRSGQGNDGVLTNMSTTTSPVIGKVGQAIAFVSANNQVVNMGNVNNIGTNDTTLSAWINAPNANQMGSIICKRNNSVPYEQYELTAGSINITGTAAPSKKIGIFIFDGAILDNTHVQDYYTTNDILDGNWHHVVFTRINGTTPHIYVDGVDQALTAVFANTTNVNPDGTGSFGVGECPDGSLFPFNGSIDETRIYNRALNQAEITRLYKSGQATMNASQNGKLTSGLVGLWSFNGPDLNWNTNVAIDGSGNGNNGSLLAMPTTTAPGMGKVGQALLFNYPTISTQEVRVTSSASIDDLAQKSISLWMKARSAGGGGGAGGIMSKLWWTLGYYGSNLDFKQAFSSFDGDWRVTTNPSLNDWHHIAITYDRSSASNAPIMYVDGVSVAVTTVATPIGSAQSDSAIALEIGNNSAQSRQFDGYLDDLRLYNRILTASEIKQLYLMGK